MHLVLAIIAILCFAADAAGVSFGRVNLQSIGLLLLTILLVFVP